MEGTADLDLFAADPVGRYLAGSSWIHWCARSDLFGVVLWGCPDRDAVCRLTRTLAIELSDAVAPHQSLVDASRLERVDAEAFEVLSEYVREHYAALSTRVTRLALVRPEGLAGAAVAGFFAVLDSPYEVQVFDDVASACAWLNIDDAEAIGAELERLCADVVAVAPVVVELRGVIRADLHDVDLRRAARAMGLSERSLQRKLKEQQTTFGAELQAARIAEAQRRMLDSDAPLTRIALDSGFTSLSHFSGIFRRAVGKAPSVWRETATAWRRGESAESE